MAGKAGPGVREREAKLSAWAGFALPDLNGVVDGAVALPLPDAKLTAIYWDTPDLRLVRSGMSLRHRAGDGENGWTVKLPEGEEGPALVRRELAFDGTGAAVPADAASLLRGFVRDAPLAPVSRLVTIRRRVELRDAEGAKVAEIDDDEVSVFEGRRVAARFREVEVEVADDAPAALLGAVIGRLRFAGAGEADPVPKIVRALGAQAVEPLPLVALAARAAVPPAGAKLEDLTARDVVRAAIASSVQRLLRHDPGVRLGDDPEDVHQARVATRRLRSDLRTFRALLDVEWVVALRDELAWIAAELGAVRDADVLDERLRRLVADLPEQDARGAAALLRRLAAERAAARTRLLGGLDSDRYVKLLHALEDAAVSPRTLPEAEARAVDVVGELVRRPWKHLAGAVDALGSEPADDALHEVRIHAKRCRYAAEAVAPVAGKPAQRLADAVAGVQTVLGDFHDAVVGEQWLRTAAPGATDRALVAGELVALERLEAARLRAGWKSAWKVASAKKLRSWLGS
jgi:CHAD domain-containing protein